MLDGLGYLTSFLFYGYIIVKNVIISLKLNVYMLELI